MSSEQQSSKANKMETDWELSHSFVSDGQGVRCACILPAEQEAYRLLVGTQSGSMWEFSVPSGTMQPVPFQHNHTVSAILSNDHVYVTGCKDGVARVFGHNHELKFEFRGHDKAVTSLAWTGEGFLVTGSWDGTAKVWNLKNGALVATLADHENTVSVCGLEQTANGLLRVATGSAGVAANNVISDHSIRIWEVDPTSGQVSLLNHVSNDHNGPIRDLALTSLGMLASCSNDGTVKLRSVETGECLATLAFLAQDPPMLLSVTSIGDVTGASGEDGTVILWSGSDSTTVRHASCVWNIVSLPDNDFATCCQDGTLRIFTQATDRMAPQSERDDFQRSVSEAIEKRRKGPSKDEISKLPWWEMRASQIGKSEGQVQVFQKDGVAIAAQWSATSQTWIEVGQVVGSNEDAGVVDGVRYDHVFPIEVDQAGGGVAKLQIGYNSGENPFAAAQRFIDAHMLPQHHLGEIADYIRQRVGNAAPTIGMDTKPSAAPAPVFDHLPFRGYMSFQLSKAVNFEKMKTKLKETNRLTDSDLQVFDSFAETLSATSRYHSSVVDPSGLDLVERMVSEWPSSQVFPALDLARLAALHPSAAKDQQFWSRVIGLAFTHCGQVTEADGTAFSAVPMLTLRLVCNCFKAGSGALGAVSGVLQDILATTERFIGSSSKHIRLSIATVLLDVSSFLKVNGDATDVSGQIVYQVNTILESRAYESEAVVRSLVALGTVLLASEEAKKAAKSLFLISKVEMYASPHGDKAKAVAKEIYSILS